MEGQMFGSLLDLANFMMSGYWASPAGGGELPRQWQSQSISVNITNLTPAEQVLARDALAGWAAVCNLTFTFANGPANITFLNTAVDQNGRPSAFANSTVQGQFLQTVTVNINSAFAALGNGPDGVGSYLFSTYIHEIGHALGLGHTGPYNSTATYGVNNIFTNDTWQWSVMSYFSQDRFGGSTFAELVTPQMADIFAVQSMYGPPTTSVGNTTYGFNSTAGAIYNFALYPAGSVPAFTIFNAGANNTLNASGYTQDQIINLNPGQWSSIGGLVNNIGIYTTTNIANAIAGSGNDLIIPNGSLSQKGTLTGGSGNDTFQGTQAGLNQYRIADMQVGDIINFTDANLSTFTFNLTGSTLNYGNNNQITFSNNLVGNLALSTDTVHGGIDLTLVSANPPLTGLPVSVSDLITLQRGIQFFTNSAEATAEATLINATPTTESVFTYAAKLINSRAGVLSQVAMADFAVMTGVTDTVEHLTAIATQFLPAQIAGKSFDPTVFAAEAYGSALSTNAAFNANFVTPFANNTEGFVSSVVGATSVSAVAIRQFVNNWTAFFTDHPEALQGRTVTQAAYGAAIGDAIGVALQTPTAANLATVFSTTANNGFSPNTVAGLVANALIDNAEGLYTPGVSLRALPQHVLLQGEFHGGVEQISLTGVAPHLDHAMI
jgi:peptidase M10/serralysin-like protein/matrixin